MDEILEQLQALDDFVYISADEFALVIDGHIAWENVVKFADLLKQLVAAKEVV